MRSENMAKNCPKCCQIAKIWSSKREILVAENDGDKKIYGNVQGWRDFAHAQSAMWSLTCQHIDYVAMCC